MVTDPGFAPAVTIPVVLLIFATAGLELVQFPPEIVFNNVVVAKGQIASTPVIEPIIGEGLTVKEALFANPVGTVTVIGPLVAPIGTVAVIDVALLTVKAAAVPLKLTEVAPVKFVPVILMLSPAHALVAESEVIVGRI